MSLLVVLSSPNTDDAPNSAPRRIVTDLPGIELEVVHLDREGFTAIPYLWVRSVPLDRFERAVVDDGKLHDVERLDDANGAGFYRVAWDVDSPLVECVVSSGGIIMDATGNAEEWRLNLWFEERSAASTFQTCCEERGVPLDIQRLSSVAGALSADAETVTDDQQQTLILALERGYFEEPRGVSQEDLAEELGISSSAVGRRLRRGYRNLIAEHLIN